MSALRSDRMLAESPLDPTPESTPGGESHEPLIHDPYLAPNDSGPPPPPRSELSNLALTSILACIPLFGPLGAIAAIVFGWAARRDIRRSESRLTGYGMATVGIVLGALMTMGWGALLSLLLY